MGYIDLPAVIKPKGAIINVKHKDNRSFEYAILSAMYNNEIKVNPERPSKYKSHLGKLNFPDIEFPVSLNDIDKFEKNNPGIGVNVYGYEKEEVYILRTNRTDPQSAIIDLLFITNEENQHYCWVKNFPKLVASQAFKSGHMYYFCKSCYKKYLSPKRLDNHLLKCKTVLFR